MLPLIKLSRHINPRLGFAPEPVFESRVWTTMLNHAEEISDVLLFVNSRWSGSSRRSFEAGEQVSPHISSIGRMAWLSHGQFAEIFERSNDGGHLSVLYKIAHTSLLIPRLIKLWTPEQRTVSDSARDDLGLKADETNELARFVHVAGEHHIIAGFGFAAEPLYLFGERHALEKLLAQSLQRTLANGV
ncbi:MAG: hypothetical protein MSG64_02760 [Pyrinomonadaceae bacterium MAG19_C2-C3]|nr:hypothetical protein [Pyrinomonadaceae bacterium MAG19_C2-C3]